MIGIDASATLDKTRDQVERIARRTAELIEVGRDLRDDEITVLEGWAGDVYGIPVQSTLDAIRLTGQLEGVILDPVYEGKSMAGLIDMVRDGDIPRDSTVLYAHLGGQPALNAYSALFPTTQRENTALVTACWPARRRAFQRSGGPLPGAAPARRTPDDGIRIRRGGAAGVAPVLHATRSIPTIFVLVPDPVGAGFVDSLARPGGNATGFVQFDYAISGKWLELLKEIAPGVSRAAVLRDPAIAAGQGQIGAIQAMAP